jgi:hypothetical protein
LKVNSTLKNLSSLKCAVPPFRPRNQALPIDPVEDRPFLNDMCTYLEKLDSDIGSLFTLTEEIIAAVQVAETTRSKFVAALEEFDPLGTLNLQRYKPTVILPPPAPQSLRDKADGRLTLSSKCF